MQISLTTALALALSVGTASSLAYSFGLGAEEELGAVEWNRKLEPALAKATASKKPVMLLFQEVPG